MNKLLLTVFSFVFFSAVYSQYTGFTPVKDIAFLKELFSAASKRTETIQSDFVQEKNLSLLSEKINSKGKFWFKRVNKIRMEYQQPYQYLMVINNNDVLIKDGQKTSRVSTASAKMLQQINRITIDCVQGTVFTNTDFKTVVYANKTSWLMELTPQVKEMKDLFKTIVVIIDNADYSVLSIEMNENSGDQTKIRFINKQLNANISDDLFSVR